MRNKKLDQRQHEKMTRAKLAEGLRDLIRWPSGTWEDWYIRQIARNARREINRLRKELRQCRTR